MARKLTFENLGDILEEYRNLLGRKFVSDHLESFDIGGMNEVERDCFVASVHPMAKPWVTLCSEAQLSAEQGRLVLSAPSRILLGDLHCIQVAVQMPNSERMLRDVKTRSKFHSGKHEADVAVQYAEFGYQVSFISEGKEKSPDLLVRTPMGEVFVECKSFRDPSESEEPFWAQFGRNIEGKLIEEKRCWFVHVRCFEEFNHRLERTLTKIVMQRIEANDLSEIRHDDDGVVVRFQKLTEPGVEIEDKLGFLDLPDTRTRFLFQTKITETGTLFRDPRVVCMESVFRPDQFKRIKKYMSKASKQLPMDQASILHVDLDIGNVDHVFDMIDSCWKGTNHRLEENHRRINAVVLSGIVVPPDFDDSSDISHREIAVIPNRKARTNLPNNFSIAGCKKWDVIGDGLIGEEGSVVFQFTLHKPLSEQLGRTLVSYCSDDGLRQIRLWQTYRNRFRFEVFTPRFGRRSADYHLNHVPANEAHFFGCTWSPKGLKLRVNDQTIPRLAN